MREACAQKFNTLKMAYFFGAPSRIILRFLWCAQARTNFGCGAVKIFGQGGAPGILFWWEIVRKYSGASGKFPDEILGSNRSVYTR